MSINRWIWTKRWNIYKIEHYSVIKKEWNDVIYSNMDGPRDYYTKWSKSVQSLICVQLCDPMDCSTPGLPVHHQLLELTQLMSIESLMPSNHFTLCHPLLLSSNFPASGFFLRSQFFAWGEHSIGASASVLPMHIQGWFPLGFTGLISLLSKRLSRVFSSITVQKASILQCSAFFMVPLSHPHVTTGNKPTALTLWTFVSEV